MKMNKLMSLILALIMVFSLAACGGTTPTDEPGTTAAQTETKTIGLEILKEEDESLINNYSLIAVDPDAKWVADDEKGFAVNTEVKVNTVGADALINWMLSEEGLKAIAEYGKEEYGVNLFSIKEDTPKSTADIPKATEETKTIRLSSTTSVRDSGLLDAILPVFQDKYGYEVEVFAKGTGVSIANAQAGNADLILVHAKASEEAFIDAGYARTVDGQDAERLTFMYNYFVLVGPKADPAGVKDAATAKDAFKAIADTKSKFISRGDESGTHKAEIKLWPEELGITTEADSVKDYTEWYTYATAGMGACLKMADETQSYIFTDKATYLTAAKDYAAFLENLEK